MCYRIEVDPRNIGVVLETPLSLNPTRVGVANNPHVWYLLNMLVDISLKNNMSIFNVCNAAIQQNMQIAGYIPGIWEVLMERARPDSVPFRRTDCTFFFENKEDAVSYQNSYPNMELGQLCEVEIIKEVHALTCDMNWLDSLDEKVVTAKDAIATLKHYWNGVNTAVPKMEKLFVGTYKLKAI